MEYFLGLYEKAMPDLISWDSKLFATKEAGFDTLEISIDESDYRLSRLDYSDNDKYVVLDAMKKNRIKIDTMCLSGHRKFPLGSSVPETEKRGLDIMQKAVDLSYSLGVRIIQLAGYDVYYDEISTSSTRERFLENLYKCTELAASKGVILAFETMENDFCNTISKAMYFVNKVNSPYLKVYPDIGNITNATENIQDDIKSGYGHIVAAHLKETVPGVFRDMKFGTGRVDFEAAAQMFKEAGVCKFTAEFWYDRKDDWKEQLSSANGFLRKILDTVML